MVCWIHHPEFDQHRYDDSHEKSSGYKEESSLDRDMERKECYERDESENPWCKTSNDDECEISCKSSIETIGVDLESRFYTCEIIFWCERLFHECTNTFTTQWMSR